MITDLTTAPTIAAIPTPYRAIIFRSRLEARWAIFFDSIGIPWQYEPEGYTDGEERYLPDFWLPEQAAFWEVKPTPDYDRTKAEMLARLTEKPVYVSVGLPGSVGHDGAHVFTPSRIDDGKEPAIVVSWDNHRQWCACPSCWRWEMQHAANGERITCLCSPARRAEALDAISNRGGWWDFQLVALAVQRAITHRFWEPLPMPKERISS